MPDSLRYLIILIVLGGIIYGATWWLANSPPQAVEIEKSISTHQLRN